MERWLVALFILIAVAIGMGAQAWVSWLEHKRRTQAMEVIKAAIEAGREPPAQVYEQLREGDGWRLSMGVGLGMAKRPWTEMVVFAALGVGFWIAFADAEGETRTAFMIVAATMSVTSVGCLALALFRGRDDKR